MNKPPHQPSGNELAQERNELAKYRSREAADRTLMAWMRTSLSLISFGFGIPTIVGAISATRVGQNIDPHRFAIIVGLAFISVGIFGMAAALKAHRQVLRLLEQDRFTYASSNTAEVVSISLLLIGAVSFLGVVIRAINL